MVRAGFFLTALAALSAACAPDAEFVDRATLLNEPAAQLRLPGAVELGRVGSERLTTLDGPQAAFDGYILGTDVDASQVRDYYARELERLGWQPDRLAGLASTAEIEAWGWCRSRVNFRLAVKDQRKAFRPEFYKGQSYRTVFDATLVSRTPSMPCPYVFTPFPTSR